MNAGRLDPGRDEEVVPALHALLELEPYAATRASAAVTVSRSLSRAGR